MNWYTRYIIFSATDLKFVLTPIVFDVKPNFFFVKAKINLYKDEEDEEDQENEIEEDQEPNDTFPEPADKG